MGFQEKIKLPSTCLLGLRFIAEVHCYPGANDSLEKIQGKTKTATHSGDYLRQAYGGREFLCNFDLKLSDKSLSLLYATVTRYQKSEICSFVADKNNSNFK